MVKIIVELEKLEASLGNLIMNHNRDSLTKQWFDVYCILEVLYKNTKGLPVVFIDQLNEKVEVTHAIFN